MCAGAIVNARAERVVYGAPDNKAGAFGTMINLNDYPLFKPQITGGILKEECASILSEFFKAKREK
jgi:tRNA(adenine34) deaminase